MQKSDGLRFGLGWDLENQRSKSFNAMKTIFLILWVLLAQAAVAAPFLVCDPYPAGVDPSGTPASFILKGLGANPIMTGAQINPDGTVQLHYDLATLNNGNYTVIVDAVNVFGG